MNWNSRYAARKKKPKSKPEQAHAHLEFMAKNPRMFPRYPAIALNHLNSLHPCCPVEGNPIADSMGWEHPELKEREQAAKKNKKEPVKKDKK